MTLRYLLLRQVKGYKGTYFRYSDTGTAESVLMYRRTDHKHGK